MKNRASLTVVALACIALVTAGCSSSSDGESGSGSKDSDALPTLTYGAFPGTQSMPLFAMKDQGLDKKNGFNLEIKTFQTVPAANSAVISGAVDAGFSGASDMTIARSQGRKVIAFNGELGPSELVLVPKDSKITDFSQLKGKKLTSFGGTTSTAFGVLAATAKAAYGLDKLSTDADIVTAPDAAALGLLDKGEVQAALISSGGIVPAMLTDKYRVLVDIGQEYTDNFGGLPCGVVAGTTEEFAKANGDTLKAFSKALEQSISYMMSTPKVWSDYAKSAKVDDPRAGALYQKYVGKAFLGTWDQSSIDTQGKFLTALIDVLGEKDFVSKMPAGLYTTEYGGR